MTITAASLHERAHRHDAAIATLAAQGITLEYVDQVQTDQYRASRTGTTDGPYVVVSDLVGDDIPPAVGRAAAVAWSSEDAYMDGGDLIVGPVECPDVVTAVTAIFAIIATYPASWHWCPGVKPSTRLTAAGDRVRRAESALATARADADAVAVAQRRSYEEAIGEVPERPVIVECAENPEPHGITITGLDGWQMWCQTCGRDWDVTP